MEIEPVSEYSQAAQLVRFCFQRGVMTNNFLSVEDYCREIEAGCLFFAVWEGGTAFFRRREKVYRMNYAVSPTAEPVSFSTAFPIVMEIPARPSGSTAEAAVAYWAENGFSPSGIRLRLKQQDAAAAPVSHEAGRVSVAGSEEMGEVLAFLQGYFDPLTGCLPSLEELSGSTVFCLRDRHAHITGVLQAGKARAGSEIRHIAVAEGLRGTGAAQALFQAYCQAFLDGKRFLWVAEENFAARKFYEKCGYVPDGWTSRIMIRRKDF